MTYKAYVNTNSHCDDYEMEEGLSYRTGWKKSKVYGNNNVNDSTIKEFFEYYEEVAENYDLEWTKKTLTFSKHIFEIGFFEGIATIVATHCNDKSVLKEFFQYLENTRIDHPKL